MSATLVVVRAAQEVEALRARQLFAGKSDQPPGDASFLIAMKERPVERIVAALVWWHADGAVKFLMAHTPGLGASDASAALVPALEALPELSGVELRYGRLLAAEEDVAPWLVEHNYEPTCAERVFEAPSTTVYDRVQCFLARHESDMPETWHTESIRDYTPETVWPLIEPYRLIKFNALQRFWVAPGQFGYDPEYSNILFDAETPLGALLVRNNSICLAVDVRVVNPITPRLRSLANLALFAHISRIASPTTTSIRTLAFRADENEHRETANLARRMGGREVAARHIYARQQG